MPYKKKNIFISKRNLTLLRYLFTNKVALFKQIHRDIFTGTSRQYVQQEIAKLLSYNFIESKIYYRESRLPYYSLTPLGFRLLFEKDAKDMRQELNSQATKHDLELVDIRSIFLKSPVVTSYYSENELKCGLNYISDFDLVSVEDFGCDAIVVVNAEGQELIMAIEYEISLKSKERYVQLFTKYYVETKIHSVLYITEKESMINTLRKVDQECSGKNDPKMHFTTFQKVLDATTELEFDNGTNEMLTIPLTQKNNLQNVLAERLRAASTLGERRVP